MNELHEIATLREVELHEVDLSEAPRPHYLTKAAFNKIDEKHYEFVGTVLFPSSDVTVGDRKDHVNVAHFAFAGWNGAHCLYREFRDEAVTFWAINPPFKTLGIIQADKEYVIKGWVEIKRDNSKRQTGVYTVELYSPDEVVLMGLKTRYIIYK